ncbi:TnsA-like heteromeric transposase endonuclease subunit [Streptomyces ochraceiscleroticus]|uniref:TnsA-like heteromeric transposase endonuclease subunit n=1 Tax=Streptomyces ochraceiscleroticus TaxID=47761 RepID=A0ABW1MLW7_9ACTN|nr:TnsA-like heteromeric transposase endonuclease subunit [Streptomyces ochraceiscleroticus]
MALPVTVGFRDLDEVEQHLPVEQMREVPLEEVKARALPERHPRRRAIPTRWAAATTGELVECVSLGRLDVALVLDFDPHVVWFTGSALELTWRQSGRRRVLVPDFLARADGGEYLVVALPPAGCSAALWEHKHAVLEEAAAAAGWRVHSPTVPTGLALLNLRWIARWRKPRWFYDPAVDAALRAACRRPRPLREAILAGGLLDTLALQPAYHLVWRQRLLIDWSVQVGPDMTVTAAPEQP